MDVAEISDEGMAVLALTENEHREQLSQIEVVRAHYKAVNETALTIQSLADQLGIDRSTLSNNLRVLDLPDFVLEHVESGALKIYAAREFLVFQTATISTPMICRDGGLRTDRQPHGRIRGNSRLAPPQRAEVDLQAKVSYNEQDWRPLGARHLRNIHRRRQPIEWPPSTWKTLVGNCRDSSHTIPADDGAVDEHYRISERCDSVTGLDLRGEGVA